MENEKDSFISFYYLFIRRLFYRLPILSIPLHNAVFLQRHAHIFPVLRNYGRNVSDKDRKKDLF
jgi:hypothetical protein